MFTTTDQERLKQEVALLDLLIGEVEQGIERHRLCFEADAHELLSQKINERRQELLAQWKVVQKLLERTGLSPPFYAGRTELERRVGKVSEAVEWEVGEERLSDV